MTATTPSLVPPDARAALEAGDVGLALKLVRPVALSTWKDGVLPDEILNFIDACMFADAETLVAAAA